MRRRARGDEGSVLVLVLGLFAVLLLLVAVVVDVSSVVLAKRALASTADGAAVSAAQALDPAAFYAQGPTDGVPLDEAGVRARVAAYASSDVQLLADVEDGHVAVVTAVETVRPPFGGWLGVNDVQITAVARARAPLAP